MKAGAGRIAVVALLVVAASVAQEPAAERPGADLGIDLRALPVSVDAVDGVEPLFRDGRVLVAGQPSKEALGKLHDLGVTVVVNLRTPAEMEDRARVPYDEAAAVAELGMEYVWIPLGGDEHPYTPAAVARFAQAVAGHDGQVLLHCTVAWRASYLWVAYLIRHHGVPLDRAMARGEAMAISPSPLAGLLDRELSLVYAEAPGAGATPQSTARPR
jgi:uncharacterized protein (TIGR01244 family)